MSGVERRIEEFNKQTDKALLDDKGGESARRHSSTADLQKAKVRRAEIEEDLQGLQSGYNEIVAKLQTKEVIADEFVSRIAEKLNKYSIRLRSNIKFPEPLDGEKELSVETPVASTQRKQLLELCTQILAFFDSPFLANPNVLDVEKANDARRMLERIILKSGNLKPQKN